MYRLLLRLLPRHRRAAYGDEMAEVFAMTRAERRRGTVSRLQVWLREVVALARFAGRDYWSSLGAPNGVGQDLRYAWRGVRGRGWRAAAIVGLFGVVLAANAVAFSAADTFVIRQVPYANPDQLVVFTKQNTLSGRSDYTNRDPIRAWRQHGDLFADIQAHDRGLSIYVTIDGVTEPVRTHRVTPGLFELLGVVPASGRPFVAADVEPGAPAVIIVSEAMARRLFVEPGLAIGRILAGAPDAPRIVGVMPSDFRFPTAVEQLWRPLHLDSVPHNVGVRAVARLRPGWTVERAVAAFQDRVGAVFAGLPEESRRLGWDKEVSLAGLGEYQRHDGVASIVAMLWGAAACLLLIACANVSSLELAAAVGRSKTYAIQTALGATRARLISVALLEGALLLAASLIAGLVLTVWGLEALTTQLTPAMRDALTNPLDLDTRLVVFMTGAGAFTWIVATLPAVITMSRGSLTQGLRNDSRTGDGPAGAARSRQWLMASQVALTVMLLTGASVYVRAYLHRIGLDKGLDTRGVVTLTVGQAPDAERDAKVLTAEILEHLRAIPWITAVSRVSLLPPSTQAGTTGPIRIDGRDGDQGVVMVSLNDVDPEYFHVMSIRAVQGRLFDATTRQDQVVIDEKFARRFWPDGSAIGARFATGGRRSGVDTYEVIGVTRDMRTDRIVNEAGIDVFTGFFRLSPTYEPLSFVVRTDDDQRAPILADVVRGLGSRLVVRVDTVEARYRRLEADTRLAAVITSGFGTIAWIVAAAGIFAVMAYLVAGRTREIGIRMALGADRRGVRALILRSALTCVAGGLFAGLVATLALSRIVASSSQSVPAADLWTCGAVTLVVVGTSVLATWLPAHRASRIDPAITLRAE